MFDDKCRELIKNVVDFMLAEKHNLRPIAPVREDCPRYDISNVFGLSQRDVTILISEALKTVTAEKWKNCVKHCEGVIDSDLKKQAFMDVNKIVVRLNDSDSS
ncbi:hypothetical protein ILUMI_05645 [Ignelater luminosus]|uniref:Uncharacterized protein n=1 Tax=Ignelater luminosus TaxID=2038154 RepID=A0A8K0D6R9_IGNLU|nr:hypothetical protein ILUMI_05645 [Ignelater luminosus]